MPIARLPNVDIAYEIIGSGPPLLLVSGLGGAAGYWRAQRDALSKDFTVVLHDHRGTGQSSRPDRYSVELMAADLIGLMDHLEIPQAHFVGHSTGGAIGQVIAIDHPGRLASMVQYASWTCADDHFRWCFDIRKTLLHSAGVQAYTHATPLFLMPPWFVRENAERLRAEEEATVRAAAPAEILGARIDAILAFDRTAQLGQISVPTMVLCAQDDILTPPYYSEELARRIPDAELVWMAQGGHACSQVLPDEFNALVLSFLNRQQALRPLRAFR
jgi:aminoacrylate hydrolase